MWDTTVCVRELETAPDITKERKTIIVMPCCAANLGNQTVLSLFTMCRLNYYHFQTGRITTESWSQSVRGKRCLRTTPGTHAYHNFSQNGRSKSHFSNFKVILNSIATTDSLIHFIQCTWLSTFIKSAAFHYSYFCYLVYPAQNLPVQKANSDFLNGTAVTDLVLIHFTQCA